MRFRGAVIKGQLTVSVAKLRNAIKEPARARASD
jgi:hypothetical protein